MSKLLNNVRRVSWFATLAIVACVVSYNPNPVFAQAPPAVRPVPDPRIPVAFTPARSHELDSFRFKMAIMGYFSGAGDMKTGVPKVQGMLWVTLTQHIGIEGLLNFGYMQHEVKVDGSEAGTIVQKGLDLLFMTALVQIAYREHLDRLQLLAGVGYDRICTSNNEDVVNSYVISLAARYQPWKHFGFEARYTFGTGKITGDDWEYRHEGGVGVYWAY